MAKEQRYTVTVTTDAAGAATVYSEALLGECVAVTCAVGTLSAGVATISTETSGQNLVANFDPIATGVKTPRQATHLTTGQLAEYVGLGKQVFDSIYIVNERVKIVVSAGGNVKTGSFDIVVR